MLQCEEARPWNGACEQARRDCAESIIKRGAIAPKVLYCVYDVMRGGIH
jgi:hypothetical protein